MKLKIAIDDALVVLKKNLEDHIVELKDAQDVWIDDVKSALDNLSEVVNREGLKAVNTELSNLFYKKPVDNRSNYSKFIGALELSRQNGNAEFEINEDDYDRMFNDNWEWRAASKLTNSSYSMRKR